MATTKEKKRTEFGDFQTPETLCKRACELLISLGVRPAAIVEPTCGVGNFLKAAVEAFPFALTAIGSEMNAQYVAIARSRLRVSSESRSIDIRCENFFTAPWSQRLAGLPEPFLIIGNPPWVTNTQLSVIGSENTPAKSNFHNRAGFDAISGKSNFDISEWMLIRLLEWTNHRAGTLALLVKTAVARKALLHAWQNKLRVSDAVCYSIDAALHFDAAVDACFLVCRTGGTVASFDCPVFDSMAATKPKFVPGYRDGQLVADVDAYQKWKHLQGPEWYKWRSGIKHDCSGVMELRRRDGNYHTATGRRVELEPDYLFPMFKSSDVARGDVGTTDRYMLVPQRSTGDDTATIEAAAPLTWKYLQENGHLLDCRKSSIYKKRSRFAVFGIGPYSFSPWKVAISGFYKSLKFRVIGPVDGRPVVLDDTCNFVSCQNRDEAEFVGQLLNSAAAEGFFKAFIFWDAKRPLTVDLLKRLDLSAVARHLGRAEVAARYFLPSESSPMGTNTKPSKTKPALSSAQLWDEPGD